MAILGAWHDHWSGCGNEHPPEDGQDDYQEQGPCHPGLPQVFRIIHSAKISFDTLLQHPRQQHPLLYPA